MKLGAPLLLALCLPWLCQCQSGPPDYVRNPNELSRQGSAGSIAILTQAPAAYKELGPVTADRAFGGSWKRTLAKMKKQAAEMGADAIIVPQLAAYDRAALSEAYLGEEGAFTPGPSSRQLKMSARVHGLAIQLP